MCSLLYFHFIQVILVSFTFIFYCIPGTSDVHVVDSMLFFAVTTKSKLKGAKSKWGADGDHIICSNQLIQVTIIVLILIMAMW